MPWNNSPQPQVGIAWSPAYTDGFLGTLTAEAADRDSGRVFVPQLHGALPVLLGCGD